MNVLLCRLSTLVSSHAADVVSDMCYRNLAVFATDSTHCYQVSQQEKVCEPRKCRVRCQQDNAYKERLLSLVL